MSQVLCLNASYEVLTVLDLPRAMTLIFDDRAEVLEADEDDPVRSPSVSFPRPLVIRLLSYVKVPYHARVPLNRKNLSLRDNGRCGYCAGRGATIDHIKPRALGGLHRWENVTLACGPCNSRKGHKTLKELGWELLNQPVVPERRTHMIIGLARSDDAWANWLESDMAVA